MSQHPHEEQFELLAAAYFDEVLDDAGLAQLKALLHEDDRRVKRFAELSQLNQMIATEITYRQQAEKFGLNLTPNDHTSTGALAELASLYEDGLQDPMNFAVWREQQANQARADRQRVWRHRAMLGGGIAALIAVVGVLTMVLIGGEDPVTPIAEQVTDDQPADSNEIVERNAYPVATITATHNAKWSSTKPAGDYRRGSALHPNDRLTLTAGFAEITTASGAVAILEAPATVELLDHNNALRLHTGKLVGICETESSKGFLVRTPHMDITDLGTRFGVETQVAGTEVHVFEGEVQAEPRYADGKLGTPVSLTAQQALGIDSQLAVQRVDYQVSGFINERTAALVYPAPFEGDAEWAGPLSSSKDPWADSSRLKVFMEGQGVALTKQLRLDKVPFGASKVLAAGQAVDTLLIHFDPHGVDNQQMVATLRFKQPILGVITSGDKLFTTDPDLGVSGLSYPTPIGKSGDPYPPSRGLEGVKDNHPIADRVVIAKDGKSLLLDLRAGKNLDQLRVIVQASADEPAP